MTPMKYYKVAVKLFKRHNRFISIIYSLSVTPDSYTIYYLQTRINAAAEDDVCLMKTLLQKYTFFDKIITII